MIGNTAYADSKCLSPDVSNDPFADLDDVMTEEEKRQALHRDLKQKLSSHKPSCLPPSKTTKASSSANTGQAAGSGASAVQQKSGQASGQKAGGQSGDQQQSGQASSQPTGSQNSSQGAGQSGSSMQKTPANGASGQGQTGSAKAVQQPAGSAASGGQQQSGQTTGQATASQNGGQGAGRSGLSKKSVPVNSVSGNGASGQGTVASGGKYTSAWGTQPPSPSNSGVVSLEPMSPSSPASSQASQSKPKVKIKSQPATNIAGTGPASKLSATASGKPSSEFLKAYGDGEAPPRESIEEIANRYNNRSKGQYGTPGNTGANSNSNYGSIGKTTGKSQTVKADDGVIKALQERLANEPDPEKKKQIQAEIDRLKN